MINIRYMISNIVIEYNNFHIISWFEVFSSKANNLYPVIWFQVPFYI